MLDHFKVKHKIPKLNPILIKRICRLCDKDSFKNENELEKHLKAEHPLDNYAQSDGEDVETAAAGDHEFEASTSRADEDYFKNEDDLNYEPDEPERSPSP